MRPSFLTISQKLPISSVFILGYNSSKRGRIMPNFIADGPVGGKGGDGFNFDAPAGQGVGGNNANCNFWDDDCAQVGGPGAPGLQGGEGGPGGPGGHGGTLDMEFTSFSAFIKLTAKGGSGGDGGRGGKGQDGGKGGRGGNGEDCEWGRHGGNGGSGGWAGVGGPGGHGGNGGVIVLRVRNLTDGGLSEPNVSAGTGGRGGDPGAAGLPGAPGDDGTTSGVFSSSSDCEDMGPMPQWGAIGATPNPASKGNGNPGARGAQQVLQLP
jgi:hypothetical protein